MNKAEFVDRIAARTGDRNAAKEVVDVAIDEIQRAVVKGEKVSFAGFGVFEKRQRAARMARNPRTGEAVKVKKTVVPAFRPGTGFKELVTGKRKAAKSATAAKKAAPAKKAATKKATTAKKAAKKTTRAASTAARSTATSRVAAKKTATKKATPAKKASTAKKAVRKTATKATAAKKTAAKKTAKRGRSLCRAPNRFGARWGTRPTRTGKRAFRSRLNALAAFQESARTRPSPEPAAEGSRLGPGGVEQARGEAIHELPLWIDAGAQFREVAHSPITRTDLIHWYREQFPPMGPRRKRFQCRFERTDHRTHRRIVTRPREVQPHGVALERRRKPQVVRGHRPHLADLEHRPQPLPDARQCLQGRHGVIAPDQVLRLDLVPRGGRELGPEVRQALVPRARLPLLHGARGRVHARHRVPRSVRQGRAVAAGGRERVRLVLRALLDPELEPRVRPTA
nr:hypothetical protein GCM10025732_55220 [Glycomyces mayteni]